MRKWNAPTLPHKCISEHISEHTGKGCHRRKDGRKDGHHRKDGLPMGSND